jgi:hypothetical protein
MPNKENLPPTPVYQPMQLGADKAVSESIQKMTGEEKQAVYLLAKLTKRDKSRLSIMESIAKDFELGWLSNYIMAFCTFSAAEEGKRSDQIVTIVKQPEISVEGGGGFLGTIRDKLRV